MALREVRFAALAVFLCGFPGSVFSFLKRDCHAHPSLNAFQKAEQ